MLTKWLPDTPNTIPAYTSHFVGVGGFVLNDKREILVVKEKSGPATQIWKIPGGIADPGEDIGETACREVLEETGIPCDFECLLSFREHHSAKFGKSDLYFVCFLKPKHTDIKIQESEIADAKWMDVRIFSFSIISCYLLLFPRLVGRTFEFELLPRCLQAIIR